MKTTILALFALSGLSAVADVTYDWHMTSDPLVDPTSLNPMSGVTAYLIDADVVNQQSVLSAVIGNGTALETYLASVSGAELTHATTDGEGLAAAKFTHEGSGTAGHAYFAVYSESLQALYFSGYSTVQPSSAGTATLVSNAYSSRLPVNYTTTFMGSMTDGAGGGWYAAAVPEPTSGVLLAFGLALLGVKRKRKVEV